MFPFMFCSIKVLICPSGTGFNHFLFGMALYSNGYFVHVSEFFLQIMASIFYHHFFSKSAERRRFAKIDHSD